MERRDDLRPAIADATTRQVHFARRRRGECKRRRNGGGRPTHQNAFENRPTVHRLTYPVFITLCVHVPTVPRLENGIIGRRSRGFLRSERTLDRRGLGARRGRPPIPRNSESA